MTDPAVISPLATWFADERALARFHRHSLGRRAVVVPPRDPAWRTIAPDFGAVVRLAAAGLPFHVVAERRYDRSGDRRRLRAALGRGATVYLPQAHQVLPRLARLMVAVRTALVGQGREECSFLFLVEGRGRAGMGLHHDGAVHGFWLQLEGRRTATIGPRVAASAPQDLDERLPDRRRGWYTLELTPGSLFYLPPRTPHGVVCSGRSLAVSLTWSVRRTRRGPDTLVEWDVASGYAEPRPRPGRAWLWTQVPVAAGPVDRDRRFALMTPDGLLRLPAASRPFARRLHAMPRLALPLASRLPRHVAPLLAAGILAPEDLPLAIIPRQPRSLDGWHFA